MTPAIAQWDHCRVSARWSHRCQIRNTETTRVFCSCVSPRLRTLRGQSRIDWRPSSVPSSSTVLSGSLTNTQLGYLRHHFVSYLHHTSVGRPPNTLLSIWPTSYNNHFFALKSQRKLLFQHQRSIYHESYCVRFVWGKVCLLLCGAEDYFRIHRQENVSGLLKGNSVSCWKIWNVILWVGAAPVSPQVKCFKSLFKDNSAFVIMWLPLWSSSH